MRTLFDVNVLIALFDADHIHHERAHDWWKAHRADGWASCPLTQNGFVRVLSQPAYPKAITVTAAIDLLTTATADAGHRFWPDSVSLVEPRRLDRKQIVGPKQITDVYLLALAVEQQGRLATFDRAIRVAAALGAKPRHVAVI